MKTTLFLLIFISISCSSDSTDCEHLKQGKFETTNADGSKTIVSRAGNSQTENYKNGLRISKYKIKWRNECEYLVFDRKVIVGSDPYEDFNNDTLIVRITDVTDDFYIVKSRFTIRQGEEIQQKIKILK